MSFFGFHPPLPAPRSLRLPRLGTAFYSGEEVQYRLAAPLAMCSISDWEAYGDGAI